MNIAKPTTALNNEPQAYDYIPPTPQTGQSPLNPGTPAADLSRHSEISENDQIVVNGHSNNNYSVPIIQKPMPSNGPILITHNNQKLQNTNLQPTQNNLSRGPSPFNSGQLQGDPRNPVTLGGRPNSSLSGGPQNYQNNNNNNAAYGLPGSLSGQGPTLGGRSRTRIQEYAEPKASLLSQKMLDGIVSKMTNEKMAINRDGTHDLIIELVNDIADRAILGVSRLSHHRGSDTINVNDVKAFFQTNYDGMKIEGHQTPGQNFREEIKVRNGSRPLLTDNHKQRLDMIKKASTNS